MSKDNIPQAALELCQPPFSYHCGYIFDAKGSMVSDENGAVARIRGWGRIQYHASPAELQDAIGDHIAKALTEYWEQHLKEQK